jgi:glycosyltransferase involved in cell wall biosynthesis
VKIHFSGVNFISTSGPNTFANRLARQFVNMGHELSDQSDYDVALVFIEPSTKLSAYRPIVQRCDGIWFKPEEFKTHNASIKACYDVADRVIWQSDFDRNMVQKWFGEHDGTVIRNGIMLPISIPVTSQALIDIRKRYNQVFVCSANWHPQKRLKANVELFQHIRSTIEPNSCLLVLGSHPDHMIADKDVFYANSVSYEVYMQVYQLADCMLHLAYLDHSPNSVVEALACGCPVMCPSDGGTKELVGDHGIILQETQQYDYSLLNYDLPPQIDVTQVKSLPARSMLSTCTNIDISNVARSYIACFDDVLHEQRQ